MEAMLETVKLEEIADKLIAFLPKLGAAFLVLIAFFLLFKITRPPLHAMLARAGLHRKLNQLLVDSLYRYTLLAVGLVMAASQVGINVAAAVAGLGVAGIAVGFAAQDALSNVIAGILIFWDKPFVVDDWITVEGEYGRVTDITLRSTRIRTQRNTYVVIPNKEIIDAVLENHSKHGEIRVDVPVGIAYKESIAEARRVILEALDGMDDMILSNPEPNVVVDALGDSSVNLLIRVWIDQASEERATNFAVVETVKTALDAAGIEIPFPHLQLFVDDVREPVWSGLDRLRGQTGSDSFQGGS